jgi:PAS domain S-box-containing protein
MPCNDNHKLIKSAGLELYRKVFYASPDYITIGRMDNGLYIDVNPGYERFTGLKREQVVGHTSLEVGVWVSPSDREAFIKAINNDQLEGFLTRLRNHAGEIRDIEASVRAVEIDGEKLLVSVMRDVTDRKRDEQDLKRYRTQLEQLVHERTVELQQVNAELQKTNHQLEEAHTQLLQSEKMAAIGQLAAGVAHEINNPIGFISSNLHSLDNYAHDLLDVISTYECNDDVFAQFPDRLDAVRSMKTKVDLPYLKTDILQLLNESEEGLLRVKKIVQDLKDFSHVGSSEWQTVDLHTGLESTLNIINYQLKYKAKVIKQYGQIPPIECLPSELNQVFMNMLVNAAQAIENFGEIVIRTGHESEYAWIEFNDNGSGISAENCKRIFDPFFTTKPIGQGTGLGLSLSYSIVQKHRGRIEVESELGRGTSFRIWLPIKKL